MVKLMNESFQNEEYFPHQNNICINIIYWENYIEFKNNICGLKKV